MTKVDQYKCDYCGEVFNDYDKCLAHEYEHQNDEIDCKFKKNCNYQNNYELFKPVKPFHDKSIKGY